MPNDSSPFQVSQVRWMESWGPIPSTRGCPAWNPSELPIDLLGRVGVGPRNFQTRGTNKKGSIDSPTKKKVCFNFLAKKRTEHKLTAIVSFISSTTPYYITFFQNIKTSLFRSTKKKPPTQKPAPVSSKGFPQLSSKSELPMLPTFGALTMIC